MIKQELEHRCLEVIAEATTHMQDAPNAKMREKWRLIRETWMELLRKVRTKPPNR